MNIHSPCSNVKSGFPAVRKFQVFLKKSGKTDWSEKVRKKSGKKVRVRKKWDFKKVPIEIVPNSKHTLDQIDLLQKSTYIDFTNCKLTLDQIDLWRKSTYRFYKLYTYTRDQIDLLRKSTYRFYQIVNLH